MSMQGVCAVCESALADRSCEQCGALVCEDHYDDDLGVCVQCASRLRRDAGRDGAGRDDARRDDDFDVLR